jgi:hypothetical protein
VFLDFWTVDLGPVAVAFLAGVVALTLDLWPKDRRAFWFYVLLTVGMLGASFSTRLHEGGYTNSLIPTFASAGIFFGLGYEAIRRRIAEYPGQNAPAYRLLFNIVFLVQLLLLTYHPLAQIPSAADRQAGEELVAALRKIPGEAYIPSHPHLAQMAGKRSYAHEIAVQDVLRADSGPAARKLDQEIRQALQEHKFACIGMDDDFLDDMGLQGCYSHGGRLFNNEEVFRPVTGRHVRPEVLYMP